MNTRKKIAIFGSGAGSNAQKIIDHSRSADSAYQVAIIFCNKPGAGILTIAEKEHIPSVIVEKEQFFQGDGYTALLIEQQVSIIVLAGFLWKIPPVLIETYPRKIINIHPALLPKYGGKGMYGLNVHQAVIDNKEKESGITIHYVDEHYDNGDIIFQATCPVLDTDTASVLASRVAKLEHEFYPKVIEELVQGRVGSS